MKYKLKDVQDLIAGVGIVRFSTDGGTFVFPTKDVTNITIETVERRFCDGCGEEYIMKRSRQHFCSKKCQKTQQRKDRYVKIREKRIAALNTKPDPTLPGEFWLVIDGTENNYEVSNLGRIRRGIESTWISPRAHPGKVIKPALTSKGYQRIILTLRGERIKTTSMAVHRIVAKAFIPNPLNKPQVNHINGVKNDNRVDNLEWVTGEENVAHAIRTGLIQWTPAEKLKKAMIMSLPPRTPKFVKDHILSL